MGEGKNSGIKKRITSVDVAKRVGVSQSTVSRVFNKNWTGSIKESTREKIVDAAEELGYTPNAIANILGSEFSNIIGIVVSKEYDAFYGEALNILANLLSEKGLHTMLFTSDPMDNINELLSKIISYQVDGVIITSSALQHNFNTEINKVQTPVVLFNGYLPGIDICAAHSDNYGAGIMMADYLVKAGHEKFAYITTDESPYSNYMPRQEAFLYGLSRHGIRECQIQSGGYSYESGVEAAKRLITKEGYPDAIFCAADKPALGVIDYAREFGLEVGKDISVTGFYAPVGVDLPAYSLTYLKQDLEGLAKDVIELLLEKRTNNNNPTRIITRPMELVLGQSSRVVDLEDK